MATKEKVLASGATLNITSGSWKEAHGLFQVVLRELGSLDQNSEINKKLMIRLLGSDEVEASLLPCMARSTYNGFKVVPQLFDEHEEARADYLEIAGEVLGLNLDPFLKSLSLSSTEVVAKS